jgi:hypothetical protein
VVCACGVKQLPRLPRTADGLQVGNHVEDNHRRRKPERDQLGHVLVAASVWAVGLGLLGRSISGLTALVADGWISPRNGWAR